MAQPAGLENSLGPSLWPHTSVYKSLMCVWTEGQNSVSSTLAPQQGSLTSGESMMATMAVSSQQLPLGALAATCVSPRENLPTLQEMGNSTKPIYR